MRITFLFDRPTQFEAPFYRFAAADPEHEVRVVFTAPDAGDPVFDPELGQRVDWGIDLLSGYPHEPWSRQAAARLVPEACDLLIVNGYNQRVFRQAARVARRAGVRTALRLDSVPWQDSGWRRAAKKLFFAAYLLRRYDLFLGAGKLSLIYLRRNGVPKKRRGLFPYAVDVEWFRSGADLARQERNSVRARYGIPPEVPLLLCLAKLHPREAPWDLLSAFRSLGKDDLWLLLAGGGQLRAELEREAPPRVAFAGYVPYPQLPALYAAADLLVLSARDERWGVSVAEALACGLPVVASSRVGAAHDLLKEGFNGFTYHVGESEKLAAAIESALALPVEKVRAASARILSEWDYAATWKRILKAAKPRG